MAQLLYDRQSTAVHLSACGRHIRLCRQVPGTETLVAAIEPLFLALQGKQAQTRQTLWDRQAAYDSVQLADALLDDKVRTLFERGKQYDRENPGRPVVMQLFPDEKFSTVVNAPLVKEPDLVEQLKQRLENLGADHPLYPLAEPLGQAVAAVRNALAAYQNAITTLKSKEAEEEIAQANLRRQFEFNYYDAMRLFGKNFAQRLFPVFITPENREEEPAAPPVV